ncbi:MAG: hypothetical protein HYZ18_01750 [Pseudogulbenkiania sp.]|nr:hypothetical protein [Pseudogulbenkiania sp.]
MKCKHFASLLLASNFLLASLPALAELEDAPLPGDFQSAQPAKQARPPSLIPQPSTEKPQANAAQTVASHPEPSRKQAASRSKPPRKATVSIKGRRKAPKIKHHAVVARRAGRGASKVVKQRTHLSARKSTLAKHVKKHPASLRAKAKPVKAAASIARKPFKIKKKKSVQQKRRK